LAAASARKFFDWVYIFACSHSFRNWHKPWRNGDGITTTLRRHFEKIHGQDYLDIVRQLRLRPDSDSKTPLEDGLEPFLLDQWIELLADWIAVDDQVHLLLSGLVLRLTLLFFQSLNVVDCPEFRKFALYGRKNVSDRDLPHQTSLTNFIYKQYLEDHRELVDEIKSSLGRVSFTSDIWSDPNLTSFMALTCHFCKRSGLGSLEVANHLLAFRLVEGAHDGENIGQIMYDIFKEAGSHHKVCFLLPRLDCKLMHPIL